ncbi:MAG: hypothetical protein QOE96_2539 [Blastocatellia bacterium]|nr:hypothetical protein [Blastocatellia bacterium]
MPSVEQVQHLLDHEIEEIQTEDTRNGWNLWVVLAATVGLLWLLTGELKAEGIDWHYVAKLIIVESLAIDGLRWLYSILGAPKSSNSEVRFYWSHHHFGTNRAQAVFELIRSTAILLLIWLSHIFPWYLLGPLVTFYSLVLLMMVLILGMSFTAYVVPTQPNRFSYVLYFALFFSWGLALILSLGVLGLPTQHVTDLRVSGLAVGVGYLVILFGYTLRVSLTAPILMNLRRRLVAGKISPSQAIHEAEIAVGGMQAIDALRDDVNGIFGLLDAMDGMTRNAFTALRSIESNFPFQDDDELMIANKLNTITSLKAGYQSFLTEREKLFNQFNERITHFHKKVRQVRVSPSAMPTINEIDRMLQTKTRVVDESFRQLLEKGTELDKKWDQQVAVRSANK